MKSPLTNLRSKWQYLKSQHGFRRAPLLTAVRLISWMVRCSVKKTVTVNFRKWGVQMLLPARWRGMGKFIFVFRENYEPELAYLEEFLAPGKTFVDVGANFGIYTMVASKLVGEGGRVVAFEPTAQSFKVLTQNIILNGFKNALAFQVALSEKAGTAQLYYGMDPVRNSLGKDPSWDGGAEEVATESLDSVLQRTSVGWVDVIKIDVEGAEELVLRGANKVVTSMRPVIIYEINAWASTHLGLSKHGATKLLQGLGYDFYIGKQPAKSSPEESSAGYFNVVAIPR
jgi:FkbM family methyltransferase